MTRPLGLLTCLLALLMLVPVPASAQSGSESEAVRQLEFAQSELDQSNFQKALNSAESALRLHPPLYEAMAYKAFALEGLGDLKVAESLLITYREIRGDWERVPSGENALARIQKKMGDRLRRLEDLAALPPFTDVRQLDTMPAFPDGSEEFLQWLVMRQQVDDAQSRVQVGGGLLGGGIGLLVGGALALGVSSALSAGDPNNANIEAVYAGGLGALFSGGALAIVGAPLTIGGAVRLGRLKQGGIAAGPQASLRVRSSGFAIVF